MTAALGRVNLRLHRGRRPESSAASGGAPATILSSTRILSLAAHNLRFAVVNCLRRPACGVATRSAATSHAAMTGAAAPGRAPPTSSEQPTVTEVLTVSLDLSIDSGGLEAASRDRRGSGGGVAGEEASTSGRTATTTATSGHGAAAAAAATQLAGHPAIARAASILAEGGVVAIPTETVYGLAANALSAEAVGRVYAAKNRPADNPLIIHVSSLAMLAGLYPPGWELPPIYEPVLRDLWPGPLTVLLPRSPLVPDAVTCGLPTMAVRMPAHPVALALIAACGFPLAAPSANSSGRPSPTLAKHVAADLGGGVIPLILDGGACSCGVESTVLDALRSPPAILRPGGVTREALVGYRGLEALQVRVYGAGEAMLGRMSGRLGVAGVCVCVCVGGGLHS